MTRRAAEVVWRWSGRAADPRPVRRHGTRQGMIGAGLAALVFVFWSHGLAYVIAGLAVTTVLLAWLSPLRGYAAVRRLLEGLGRLVGAALTWILLVPFFYLAVTPFGLLFKRGRRDPLERSLDAGAPSYWRRRTGAPGRETYGRQF